MAEAPAASSQIASACCKGFARPIPSSSCTSALTPKCLMAASHTNAGFMIDKCKKSCNACPTSADDGGPKATALIRDAWQEETLGPFLASFKAHLVEPHEAR